MLSVLHLDTSAFAKHTEDFISVFFSVIGTDRISVEHKFVSALFATPAFLNHPIFDGITVPESELSAEELFKSRFSILDGELPKFPR